MKHIEDKFKPILESIYTLIPRVNEDQISHVILKS
jgi:hypothetical protein